MPRAVEKSASSPSPSSSPSSSAAASAESYDVGDWVLVEQQGMWWEARVLAVRSQQEAEDGKCLKVHYMGWNSKWNMWVGAGYTRRLTADTRRRADEDNRRARQAKVAAKRSRSAAAAAAGGARGGRRRRRAAEEGAQPEAERRRGSQGEAVDVIGEPLTDSAGLGEGHATEADEGGSGGGGGGVGVLVPPQLSPLSKACQLPGALRRRLLVDWQWITRKRHILRLPRLPSLSAIFAGFLASLPAGAARDVAAEVVSGLLLYFERSLATLLLYRIERPQLSHITSSQQLHHSTSTTWPPSSSSSSSSSSPSSSIAPKVGEQKSGSTGAPPVGRKQPAAAAAATAAAQRSSHLPQLTAEWSADRESMLHSSRLEESHFPHSNALHLLSASSHPSTLYPPLLSSTAATASSPHSSSSSSSPSAAASASLPPRPLSSVYGGEHALRLLVKLPALLTTAELSAVQLTAMCSTLTQLIRWMAQNEAELFTSAAYEFADKQYLTQLTPHQCRDTSTSPTAPTSPTAMAHPHTHHHDELKQQDMQQQQQQQQQQGKEEQQLPSPPEQRSQVAEEERVQELAEASGQAADEEEQKEEVVVSLQSQRAAVSHRKRQRREHRWHQ